MKHSVKMAHGLHGIVDKLYSTRLGKHRRKIDSVHNYIISLFLVVMHESAKNQGRSE